MPLDEPDLALQEALDLAAFLNSHERPKFRLRDHLPEEKRLGEDNSQSDR